MKRITCYLDFISPYAALAFAELPAALMGLSYSVAYRPVLFAGLLKHHGQLGPAEIAPKRTWTYRQVLWQAHTLGHPLALPAAHPFNSLPLLRLAWACCDAGSTPNRRVCSMIMNHVWQGGADAASPERLAALAEALQPMRDPQGAEVKAAVREATDEAIAAGVFGVPTFVVDGQVFFGLDSLPMLAAYLRSGTPVDQPWWPAAAQWPVGVQRPR
jgi:2-hydroxychromene-2-carboxylate isomerase